MLQLGLADPPGTTVGATSPTAHLVRQKSSFWGQAGHFAHLQGRVLFVGGLTPLHRFSTHSLVSAAKIVQVNLKGWGIQSLFSLLAWEGAEGRLKGSSSLEQSVL